MNRLEIEEKVCSLILSENVKPEERLKQTDIISFTPPLLLDGPSPFDG
jgi:hypothetical protein